jgi:hypothetical protein
VLPPSIVGKIIVRLEIVVAYAEIFTFAIVVGVTSHEQVLSLEEDGDNPPTVD